MHPLWARNNRLMQWAFEQSENTDMRFRSYYTDVEDFHRFFGHNIAPHPMFLDANRAAFREALIEEEFAEFADAVANKNIVEAADALADLVYVVIGTAIEMGIPFDKVWRAVHESNMLKSMKASHDENCALMLSNPAVPARCSCGAVAYTETGKTAKPKGWEEPQGRIKRILEQS